MACKHLATLGRGQGGLCEFTRAKGQPRHRKGRIPSRRRARKRQRPLRRDLSLRNWCVSRWKSHRTEQLLSRIFFRFCDSGAVTGELEHINRLSAVSPTPGNLDPIKTSLELAQYDSSPTSTTTNWVEGRSRGGSGEEKAHQIFVTIRYISTIGGLVQRLVAVSRLKTLYLSRLLKAASQPPPPQTTMTVYCLQLQRGLWDYRRLCPLMLCR